jgi:hypothetical protein
LVQALRFAAKPAGNPRLVVEKLNAVLPSLKSISAWLELALTVTLPKARLVTLQRGITD